MPQLFEDISLRDRLHVFKDRKEAGVLLGKKLSGYKDKDTLVFSIPLGGVPIGVEIAAILDLKLHILIARKILIPHIPEAGFGAVGPDGTVLLNKEILIQLSLTLEEIELEIEKTMAIVKKRKRLFKKGSSYPLIKDKTVIISDDGLASGFTMLTVIEFIKKQKPLKIIAAVPTAYNRTVDFILPYVDELLCLNVRSKLPFVVADAYENWHDLDLKEEEIASILSFCQKS